MEWFKTFQSLNFFLVFVSVVLQLHLYLIFLFIRLLLMDINNITLPLRYV